MVLAFLGVEFDREGDFYFYYSVASKFFSSPDLYDQLYGKNQVFDYSGSPVLTLLFYPLTKVPIIVAALFWKLLSIAALYRLWRIFEVFVSGYSLTKRQRISWLVLIFFSVAFLIYSNLHHVQLTIVLLYCAIEGYLQIYNKRMVTGLAVDTNIPSSKLYVVEFDYPICIEQ